MPFSPSRAVALVVPHKWLKMLSNRIVFFPTLTLDLFAEQRMIATRRFMLVS
jgi:hypothetical protein